MQIKTNPSFMADMQATADFAPRPLQLAISELARQPIREYGWRLSKAGAAS